MKGASSVRAGSWWRKLSPRESAFLARGIFRRGIDIESDGWPVARIGKPVFDARRDDHDVAGFDPGAFAGDLRGQLPFDDEEDLLAGAMSFGLGARRLAGAEGHDGGLAAAGGLEHREPVLGPADIGLGGLRTGRHIRISHVAHLEDGVIVFLAAVTVQLRKSLK